MTRVLPPAGNWELMLNVRLRTLPENSGAPNDSRLAPMRPLPTPGHP
jgi:hypothetical protein